MKQLALPCSQCGSPVMILEEFAKFTPHPLCERCGDVKAQAQRIAARLTQLRDLWRKLCPPIFQDTDLNRLPKPDQSQKALSWTGGEMGLNLWGFPATGKTRTMYALFKHHHFAGKAVLVLVPGEFGAECERRNFHRGAWLNLLCGFDLLGFDDVDKMSLTKDQEAGFFSVVDRRATYHRPTFFTHNSNAAELEHNFRFGAPLVRRIREFTESIHFPEK